MEPLHQSDFIYGISDAPMSQYDDDGTNPTSLVKFVTTDQQAAEISVTPANNEGHSTGTDWATEQWVDRHDVNIPFSIDATVKMMTRLLNAGMGGKVTSTPDAGVEKNVFTPQDAATSRQLPMYWLGEQLAARHDALYPSCVLEKLTIQGEESGKLNMAGNFRGSGLQIMGGAVPINPETDKYYLKNTQTNIKRATAATPGTVVKNYQCGLQSYMFDIENAPDQGLGYDPGCQRFYTDGDEDSGIIRSHHLFGRRKYTSKFVIWLESSAPEIALLRNQAELNLKMGSYGSDVTAGFPNFIEFELFLAKYSAVVIGNKGGFVTMEITPDAFYDETNSQIVQITTQHAA